MGGGGVRGVRMFLVILNTLILISSGGGGGGGGGGAPFVSQIRLQRRVLSTFGQFS